MHAVNNNHLCRAAATAAGSTLTTGPGISLLHRNTIVTHGPLKPKEQQPLICCYDQQGASVHYQTCYLLIIICLIRLRAYEIQAFPSQSPKTCQCAPGSKRAFRATKSH